MFVQLQSRHSPGAVFAIPWSPDRSRPGSARPFCTVIEGVTEMAHADESEDGPDCREAPL